MRWKPYNRCHSVKVGPSYYVESARRREWNKIPLSRWKFQWDYSHLGVKK
jgi:hypothetical protein